MKVEIVGCIECPYIRENHTDATEYCGHRKVLSNGNIDPNVDLYSANAPVWCPLRTEPVLLALKKQEKKLGVLGND
jgi:hypothetical protein